MRKWLREIREKEGLTQAEAAKKAGLARSTYSNIESGVRGCNVKNAKKIADAFDFEWTIFFEDESHESKHNAS